MKRETKGIVISFTHHPSLSLSLTLWVEQCANRTGGVRSLHYESDRFPFYLDWFSVLIMSEKLAFHSFTRRRSIKILKIEILWAENSFSPPVYRMAPDFGEDLKLKDCEASRRGKTSEFSHVLGDNVFLGDKNQKGSGVVVSSWKGAALRLEIDWQPPVRRHLGAIFKNNYTRAYRPSRLPAVPRARVIMMISANPPSA